MPNIRKRFRKANQGFTLLEVLAVIAIIGIMTAMIAPKVGAHVVEARQKACLANMQYLEGVLEQYKMVNGEYPTDAAALKGFHPEDYPVSPRMDKSLVDGETGYAFSDTGKVFYNSSESGLIELTNPVD